MPLPLYYQVVILFGLKSMFRSQVKERKPRKKVKEVQVSSLAT